MAREPGAAAPRLRALRRTSSARGALLLATLAVALLAPLPALAWGHHGHQLVCEIAFQEMAPATRAEVERLIRLDPDFSTFSASCIWPDLAPKKRPDEHYVNLPRTARHVTRADCPEAPRCLFSALADDRHEIALPTTTDRRKLELLKYLGHWVGDLHTPFHVGFGDDRGGGGVHEVGEACAGDNTLHQVWDVCLVEERVLTDRRGRRHSVRATAKYLLRQVSDAEREAWRGATPEEWAEESYAITTDPETEYCTWRRGRCAYAADNPTLDRGEPERTVLIDDAYLDRHAPTVRRRLEQAGVRLAALLDRLLAPAADPKNGRQGHIEQRGSQMSTPRIFRRAHEPHPARQVLPGPQLNDVVRGQVRGLNTTTNTIMASKP